MQANKFQTKAMQYCPVYSARDTLLYGAIGLCGESGEASEIVKKHLFQGHPLNEEHLKRELGDVAWYLACTATALGVDLEDIFAINIQKLEERYPNGYSNYDSVNRKPGDV